MYISDKVEGGKKGGKIEEDKLLACVCVCLLCSFLNGAGRYAKRLSETERNLGGEKVMERKKRKKKRLKMRKFPVKFEAASTSLCVLLALSRDNRNEKEKKNNPQTFQEISIVERISLSLSLRSYYTPFWPSCFLAVETLYRRLARLWEIFFVFLFS